MRVLGKYRFIDDLFTLFASMRRQQMEPDDESYEFLSASLVASVKEEASAVTMKDLPSPDLALPEIVFAGRSNVGKSSLVNFLVGRKVCGDYIYIYQLVLYV